MPADTNKQSLAVAACIEKVKRWQHDNKQFGWPTPEGDPILAALEETLVTGKFAETRAGILAQELARNEYRISQAEAVVFANRADPIANLPNVEKFLAAIREQAAIIARFSETK